MKHIYLLSLSILLLGGCAMRTKILDVAAISMTQTSLKPGEKLTEVGAVSGKFCSDQWNDKGNIGLIDESVKAAQATHKIDWIINASIWREGNCVDVEGTGAKLMASAGTTAAPAAKAPAKAKAKK